MCKVQRPFVLNEPFLQTISSSFVLLRLYACFMMRLLFHFSLYQFKVAVKRGCEAMVHGIRATLDVHPNWVVF